MAKEKCCYSTEKTLTRNVFQNILWKMIMPEVVLPRVAFIPRRDLDGLEMKINDLIKKTLRKNTKE